MPKLLPKVYDELVDDLLNGISRTGIEARLRAGFKPSNARTGRLSKTIETKSFKDALKRKGLSEEQAKHRVAEMLEVPLKKEKVMPDDILRAADQTFRLFGSYAPEKHITATIDLFALLTQTEEAEKRKEVSNSRNSPPIILTENEDVK